MIDVKRLAEMIVQLHREFENHLYTKESSFVEALESLLAGALEEIVEVASTELKENFKHWTDVAKLSAYEQAAQTVDSIWEANKDCDPEAGYLLEKSIAAIRALVKT